MHIQISILSGSIKLNKFGFCETTKILKTIANLNDFYPILLLSAYKP